MPEINDLIFKELIKRGYSLEGKTRVWNIADSKLWYLTPEQSQAYLDLDSDSSYKQTTGQKQAADLLTDNITQVLKLIGNDAINIVDLGCGDGIKSARFIEQLTKRHPHLKIRYCPIDISGYMVQKAIETFSKLNIGEIIEFQYNISDFENLDNVTPLLKNGDYKKNVILLLGNTLGNFEINDLLYKIRVSMDKEDIFIADTGINDNQQEKKVEAYKKNRLNNEWLIHIPLGLGLSKNDIEFGVRFRNSRLEGYYTLNKDKTIKFQDKTVYFSRGDQIVVIIAYKHNKEDLKSYLNMHFDNVSVKFSKDSSKAVAICLR